MTKLTPLENHTLELLILERINNEQDHIENVKNSRVDKEIKNLLIESANLRINHLKEINSKLSDLTRWYNPDKEEI